MSGVLAGLRIVESAAFVAAPSAGMTLAQLGADVIRIDPLGGGLDAHRWPVTKDGKSLYWAGLNKGKRSIRIDITRPEGRELAIALITAPGENAGLCLTNFPATGWLDYASLKRRRSDLVMVSIIGDSAGRTALDYTVNAAAGFTFVTGPTDVAGPVNNVVPAWDLVTGQSAALGLIAAERHRRLTGEGQLVRIALADVAFAAAGALGYIADVEINDAHRPHYGNDVFGAYGRDFATKDGRRLMVVAITRGQWEALKKATGLGAQFELAARSLGLDFAREGERYEGRAAITAILERWFAARGFVEAAEVLESAGVCWGPYQTFQQMVHEDPRVSPANPMFQRIEQPGIGRYLAAGNPLDFGVAPRGAVPRAPILGEHTDEILLGVLKLGEREVGALHDKGLVAGAVSRDGAG
ncbi:MAG TPA: CoA transferase [Stellaceae bacterium]|jgi:2-methylfumaryl-CoA isomerase|nr:CoA transferase [Stellaceae bacterium]